MKKYDSLPKGYYYVGNKFDGVACFKGKKYAVRNNINFFSDLSKAVKNATAATETAILGVNDEYVGTPIILVGTDVSEFTSVALNKSIVVLGDGARINGSFWYGLIELRDGCDKAVIDSLSLENIRIFDFRWNAGDHYLVVKNITYVGMQPWNAFLCLPRKPECKTHYRIENIRADGIDGYGYGKEFMLIAPTTCSIDNLVYKNTDKPFGFSSFDKKFTNAPSGCSSDISVENSEFADDRWQKGFTVSAAGDVSVGFDNCKFIDCCGDDAQELFDFSVNENSSLSFTNCSFSSEKEKKLVTGRLLPDKLKLDRCNVRGFLKAEDDSFLFDENGLYAAFVKNELENITDRHETAECDFSVLEKRYAGRTPFYCDMHSHSDSGGTSDGAVKLADWPKEMKDKRVDFVAIADHQQMRHFFIPEFDETKFFYATEPEALIEGDVKFDKLHYDMIFPDKYLLGKTLERFHDKYEFRGDELTGSFVYKNFTHDELAEVAKFVTDHGGMFVHAHPMAMLVSDNIENFCFGDKTYIEIFSNDYTSILSFNDWKLWTSLLSLGKKVYNISGSDSHAHCSNSCVNVVYAEKRLNSALFPYFKTGDFSSGAFGIKMTLGDTVMGGTAKFNEGDELLVEIDDLFDIYKDKNMAFSVRIVSDKGVAYSCLYDGKEKLRIALHAEKRKFYRVEIIDLAYRTPFGLSNPIWID